VNKKRGGGRNLNIKNKKKIYKWKRGGKYIICQNVMKKNVKYVKDLFVQIV
jgi:hypothetical protein